MVSYEEMYAHVERHVDALKTNKTGDERQTDGEVFDRQTLMLIYDFMTGGMIESIHYPVSTGKEGNVFYATDPDGEPLALKIFRTSTSTFKRVSKYIEGDPRFKGLTGNRRKIIYAWTNKEYRNLQRYYEAELPVPEPIMFKKNCLLMEYIGDEDGPAPLLKDVELKDPTDMYDEIVSFIIDGFRDAHLVHGDLSEYNILVWDGEPVVIDCGQAMTADHFNAKEYLLRDINNVNRFFKNRGADIIDPERILEEAYSEDDDSDTEEEEE
ncbi:MAG: serine protein kinase RIO [Candidatus Methanomethylophilaceae archaeon]|nr:serine protein kinase RIO [Candidatus Methanomethylophilaceae archaeon]MDY5872178.1 serine protein kinase RIO [Candidatus Methanomethylophilaceae archaeon]